MGCICDMSKWILHWCVKVALPYQVYILQICCQPVLKQKDCYCKKKGQANKQTIDCRMSFTSYIELYFNVTLCKEKKKWTVVATDTDKCKSLIW